MFKYLFIVTSILEVLSQLSILSFQNLHVFTKPMLMPALALYFLAEIHFFEKYKLNKTAILIIIALIFAWFGDLFLMWTGVNPNFFMAGLGSFLIMQLCYIFLFKPFNINDLKENIILNGLVILFGISIFSYLYNTLGPLQIPVFVYFLAILSMVLSAVGMYAREAIAGKIVVWGAVLFMISDSLIAINKFKFNLPYSGFLIMITYILAQWLIINGLLKSKEFKR